MPTIAELAALAAKTSDQSKDTAATYEAQLPPAGQTPMRFIEYIELGHQPQKPFQGKPKQPCPEVILTFELLGQKYVREVDVEGGKKLISDILSERVQIKLSDKANFRKLFGKMTYGRSEITHLAQMLGEPFKGTITHSPATNEKGEAIKQYANLRTEDGTIGIAAPFMNIPLVDADGEPTGETERKALKVRDPLRPLRIFLFDNPTKETWDSLFIDGYREIKNADGTTTKQSKNWIQERILGSTQFTGSALEALLHEVGGLSIDPEVAPASDEVGSGDEVDQTPAPATGNVPPAAAAAQANKAQATKPSATDAAADALAALGLEAA